METTRVDLHLHSNYSDGALTPRQLAQYLAEDKVAYAALTDHDTVEGTHAFAQAAARLGIGVIPGVEITTWLNGREVHLLGYGIDAKHAELQATLLSLRRMRTPAGASLREAVGNGAGAEEVTLSAARTGRISSAEAIALIHRAGGKAFLAHPLALEAEPARLRQLVSELQEVGLDGIEVTGGAQSAWHEELLHLAEELDLLVTGGSDAHDRRGRFGVDLPTTQWRRLRDAVCCGPGLDVSGWRPPRHRMRYRRFFFHVVFPTLLAVALFVGALFGFFLPSFERALLERKREMIRELTNAAWSILAGYERDERQGRLTRLEAQRRAVAEIQRLRYGPEGKDYFWVQDMQPRMIMHPYRSDLNGKDVSEFRDERGVRIFVQFVELVRRQGEGYIDYVWQWKDDPHRLAPKESYIKGFPPWGWIVGTGLYIEDVREEIARIEGRLVKTSAGITALVVGLLLYVLRRSVRLEHLRSEAEEALRESTERYRSLVEATTEGTLLVLEGRCRYANPTMLRLLGCSEGELQLLELAEVLPRDEANTAAWENIARAMGGEETTQAFEGVLVRRDGGRVECVLALSRIPFGDRNELILLAKPVGRMVARPGAADEEGGTATAGWERFSEQLTAGVFRARASQQGTVVAATAAARRLLELLRTASSEVPLALAGVFPDRAAWKQFLDQLQREGTAEWRLHATTDAPTTRVLVLRAVLVREGEEPGRFVDGVIEDVTAAERRAAEREALIERLQASLLFLHEPLSQVARVPVFCPLDTPVHRAAAMMSAERATAVLVQSDTGEPVGIFTDRDLRERVVAVGGDLEQPLARVMSAPLVRTPQRSAIYEALAIMEERGIQHLAVEDDAGRVCGIVEIRDLLTFPSYGPIVLTREVAQAQSAEDVVNTTRRAPRLAKALLDSGGQVQRVTRMITAVCDATTERFVALAQEQLGPPPAPFVFIGLGSQGREEQVLSSDQDNALIFSDEAGASADATAYFRELGALVCRWLDAAGYPYCAGGVMAQNPKWCQPLSVWKEYFSGWVRRAQPEEVREFSIFFDLRAITGSGELADELRAHVLRTAVAHAPFLAQLAGDALQFKAPLRLFGRVLVGGTGSEPSGAVNLKDAVRPLVAFARLYALRSGIAETHTLDRLRALQQAGVLSVGSYEETVAAYETLMRLRLRHQAAELNRDAVPDNVIYYRHLGQADEALLHQAFAQIAAVQRRISHDFLGGMSVT